LEQLFAFPQAEGAGSITPANNSNWRIREQVSVEFAIAVYV
jgi:hypothetical protein